MDRDRAVRHDELCLTGHVVDDFQTVVVGIGDLDALERSALVRGIEDADIVALVCRANIGIRVSRTAFADIHADTVIVEFQHAERVGQLLDGRIAFQRFNDLVGDVPSTLVRRMDVEEQRLEVNISDKVWSERHEADDIGVPDVCVGVVASGRRKVRDVEIQRAEECVEKVADLQDVFIAEVGECVRLEGVVETDCYDLRVRVDVMDRVDDRVPVVEEQGHTGDEAFQISGGSRCGMAEGAGNECDGAAGFFELTVGVQRQNLSLEVIVEAVVVDDVKGTDQTVQRDVVGTAGDGDEFGILDVLDCFRMQGFIAVRVGDSKDLSGVLIALERRVQNSADLVGPKARERQVVITGGLKVLIGFQ